MGPLRAKIEVPRKTLIRQPRLKHRAVADSLEEAGEYIFVLTYLPPSQAKTARAPNVIERLPQPQQPCWSVPLVYAQINVRKVNR